VFVTHRLFKVYAPSFMSGGSEKTLNPKPKPIVCEVDVQFLYGAALHEN
jgi:hypothetical protein